MRTYLFGELLEVAEALESIQETLTYDQLFRMSDPKRFARSRNVKMPPMEMDTYQTDQHWVFAHYFNAKSTPGHSTTGLRHRGYVRFKKPKRSQAGKNTPLSQLPVEVDCMCPDYKYRWAWANKQKRAGHVGKNSLNQCLNQAPRITNPTGKPGLCKHILATRDFIYGLLSDFPEDVGPSTRLDILTRRATKRWLNFDAEMAQARERDAKIAAAKARRNVGLPPERQNRLPNKLDTAEPPPLPELPGAPGKTLKPVPVQPVKPPQAPKAPQPELAVPVGSRGRGFPPAPAKPAAKPAKKGAPGADIKGLTPGQFIGRRFMKTEGVVSSTNMKTLTLQEAKVAQTALRLVEEMGDEMSALSPEGEGEMPPAGPDMPIEPPVSDSAVGASTQDNVALGLLREIRDLIAQLAADEAAEGGEAPEIPEEEGPLKPGEGGEGDEFGEDEDFRPGKRPMPVTTGAE